MYTYIRQHIRKVTETLTAVSIFRKNRAKTRILSNTSREFIENGGRLFQLKREANAKMINQYNPKLLALWKVNMDIQRCGSSDRIAYNS